MNSRGKWHSATAIYLQIYRSIAKEDLIQKATGWMLREAGKRDEYRLRQFLDKHLHDLPRTTLRYAIERFPESLRLSYLKQ